jgi:excisionase family DNA binding protein
MIALTVKQIADRYGVSEGTVGCWIRSGELRAMNAGRTPTKKKPRWKIMPEALAAFELARTASPPLERTRRRGRTSDLVEFIR